jgi:hypothetical protein
VLGPCRHRNRSRLQLRAAARAEEEVFRKLAAPVAVAMKHITRVGALRAPLEVTRKLERAFPRCSPP